MFSGLELSVTGIYLVTFFAYMFTTSLGESKVRGLNKIFLAALYVLLGVLLFIKNRNFASFDILLLIAIVFTAIGDVILLVRFNLGALFFTIGNLSIFVYDFLLLESKGVHFGNYWWFVFVYIFFVGGYWVLERFSTHFKIEKKDRLKAFGYLALVSLHGSLGLTMYFLTDYSPAIMLGIGSFMYMMSDYVLCSYKYSTNHEISVHKLNTFLYFAGILLVTWSICNF